MENKYIIGVDGGGTKTDYLLFTVEGKWVDSLRVGSRSHEVLPGGFAEAYEKISADLNNLLTKNKVLKSQVAAAAFGMAGIDTPSQQTKLTKLLGEEGFKVIAVANDSVLGIKAGCPSGTGICSINGTGTALTGMNEQGEILQIGGIGYASGDSAGGGYIAGTVVRAVYDSYFRCGQETAMTEAVMKLFGIDHPLELLNAISEQFYEQRELDLGILNILFDAANTGDEVAMDIVRETAKQLAKSVAGCMKVLHFNDTPDVVLAGSVWTKSKCPLLLSHFQECVYQLSGNRINPVLLEVIPATGAVIWAKELAKSEPATKEQRELMTKEVLVHWDATATIAK